MPRISLVLSQIVAWIVSCELSLDLIVLVQD